MEFIEEKLERLEDKIRILTETVDEYLRTTDNQENKGALLSVEQAYIRLTGNKHVTPSAHSQYMNSLVKQGLIHKVLIGGRPKYDPKELDELIEKRKVTGRFI
ncbi:hypothetical protein AB0Y21_10335 [Weissella paramesenteroides]|uniref:hypothetical protein n=1 Tax=Weissella paramesenteroides TaxID=1249 RepID=UPI003F1E5C38